MRKTNTAFLILFFLVFSFFPLLSLAQEEDQIDSEITPVSEQTEEEIKEIRDAVKKKVQEKIDQITSSVGLNEKRSWHGTVESIKDQEIEIKSVKDQIKTIRFSSDTDIVGLKRQTIAFEDLKEGQQILAMGIVEEETVLEGRRVLLIPSPTDWSQTKIAYAKISDISADSEILVLTPLQNKNEQYEVKIDNQTKSNTEFADFENGQKIIAVLTQSKNGKLTYTARRLKILEE